jgi:regulator of protease activity HflC (stomatin/prohibitin superfamily)
MELLTTILLLLAYIALIAVAILMGRPSRFTLLEHQRGVLYRRGLPIREVGSGRYWVWTKREKFFWTDTRPIQVAFDNQGAVLKDGATAAFGILGSARITEARKAIYSARNYNQIPAFVFLCCTRAALNGLPAAQLADCKEKLADQIISKARSRLAASGFELLTFRFTQLSVAAGPPRGED